MAWFCYYATGYFVAFLDDISMLKSGWNMKKIFCCPALELFNCLPLRKTLLFISLELFHCLLPLFWCLPLWKTVRLHGKKLQNATNFETKNIYELAPIPTLCEYIVRIHTQRTLFSLKNKCTLHNSNVRYIYFGVYIYKTL